MQKTVRNTTVRTHTEQNKVAIFADVRPAATTVEPAGASSIDLPAAIRKRPLLAILIILLSLLIGGPYILRKTLREYRAEATIYVSPTYFKNFQDDREQLQISYSTLVNQQILTIRRYDVLTEALKRLETRGIKWRRPNETEAAAVERLTQQLEIKQIPDSYEVLIAMNGDKREWLAPIVNTITDTYLEKGKSEEQSDRSNRFAALTAEQSQIETRLQKELADQSKLSEKLMVVDMDKAAPVDDTLLAAARQAYEEARRKRIEAETQILSIEASTVGSSKNALTAMAEEAAANDSTLRTLTGNLLQRSLELRSRMEGMTPEHPLRQATERELAAINDQLTSLPLGYLKEASARLLAKLRSDVARTRLLETQLGKEVTAESSRVQAITTQVQQAQGLRGEIDRLRKSQSTVKSGIDELTMQGGSPGYLRIFSAAQPPIEPNKTNRNKLLGALLGAAVLLAIGLCVAMDLLDQRIFAPFEVKRAVGFTPVGMVLERSGGNAAFAEEHFCRLVNGIQRGIAVQDAKSILLTPLRLARTPGSLVTDIGRALAARGLKTVIIDANPRRGEKGAAPQPSEINSVPLAIQNADSRTPSRIELGLPEELSRVAVIAPIAAMLEDLKAEYDVILIDAAPLRFSADTEFLAATADISLVIVETGEATRQDLIQGTTLLGQIGAASVGVIMNQVRLPRGGTLLNRDFKRFSSLSWSTAPGVQG